MGIFGRPSQRLIQALRDELRHVALEDPLPIPDRQIASLTLPPAEFNLTATTGAVDYRELVPAVSATLATGRSLACRATHVAPTALALIADTSAAALPVSCASKHCDPTVKPPAAAVPEIAFPALRIREPALLTAPEQRTVLDMRSRNPPEAIVVTVNLPTHSDARVTQVNLGALTVTANRFSFCPVQSDPPAPLFRPRNARPATFTRLPPIPPPEPPPTLKGADLTERLRLLLSPPIHEVLSDPQLALPERPFPYQAYGIKWLYDRHSALLADEMGLGKTMQAIIAARLLWKDGVIKQILVVCPKSLIPNWRKELGTWWPGAEWYTRTPEGDRNRFYRLATKDVLVKLISYESLRRDVPALTESPPYHDLVIIDEGQRIKSPTSDTSQAVKALKADRRWALTGTPLENSTKDIVSLFGFLKPGLIRESDSVDKLQSALKPYMLRRRQEEVLKDLPEKVPQDVEIELADRQRAAYDRAERQGVIELNEKGDTVTVTHVFALINKLRQICNCEQVSGESAKADLLVEELDEILESGRKALIFCDFVNERFGLKRLAQRIGQAKTFTRRPRLLEVHGDVSAERRAHALESFQKDPDHQLLLLNYAVGGVGLNLQAANYVFLFDRWWNPAVEDQAISRCYRLGQRRTVFAKRFYCKGTIEERMLKKLEEKRRFFSHVIDQGRPAAALGLTEEELFSLFGDLTVRPHRRSQAAAPSQVMLDNLDDKQFEILVAQVYEKLGYAVSVTGRSHDGGIDIWAERLSAGGKDVIVVQCKHQKQSVGRPVLQQLWGVVSSDSSVTQCAVVTSAGFSREAQEFARGKRMTLIDRSALEELARKHGIAEFVSAGGDRKADPGPRRAGESAGPPREHQPESRVAPARRSSGLDKWDGKVTLGEVRTKLKERKEFAGSWEGFLDYVELPRGIGLTRDTTVAEARRLGGR
jgi:superfamily II DNA or RNA helicase